MTGSSKTARILAAAFAVSSVICVAPGVLAHEAGPPDSLTYLYEVEGVKVIQRRVLTSELVAVNLYLLGGARQITESTAGIEPLLLRASERGTRNYPGPATLEAQARTGSRMVVSALRDWTIFGFRGLAEEFDSTWAVFADRLMYPTLDSAAVEATRERMLAAVRSGMNDPDVAVWSLARSLAFSGHAYAVDVDGTEESLGGITIEDVRTYLNDQIVSSRMLLVVVGNVSREVVEEAVRRTIGQLPRGDYVWELPPTWEADDPVVEVQHRNLPASYIVGYFGGPKASSDDYLALTVATALLSAIVFNEVRDEGLSYDAGASLIESGAAGGAVYVSTAKPKESMEIINDVIELIQQARVSWTLLTDWTKGWIINFYLDHETNAQQADFLARSYLYRGELQTPKDRVDELRGLSPYDVRNAATRYMKNIQYAYLGDITDAPRELMREH
ncbi:MAG: insulinase family protein [Gemmatimonadota bacterium]|nr:MAG: insulinase family protein [Gemmatimonadota bacterium]